MNTSPVVILAPANYERLGQNNFPFKSYESKSIGHSSTQARPVVLDEKRAFRAQPVCHLFNNLQTSSAFKHWNRATAWSFIDDRFGRILPRHERRRIECPEQGRAHGTAAAIGHHPGTIACGNDAGTISISSQRPRKLNPTPTMLPPRPSRSASWRMALSIRNFEAPNAFRMPISCVRCGIAMYIESEATATPITTATPTMTLMNGTLFAEVNDRQAAGS